MCYSASGLAYTLAAWSSWTLRVGVFCALHPVMQWLLLLLTLGLLLMRGATVIVPITEQRRRRSIRGAQPRDPVLPRSPTSRSSARLRDALLGVLSGRDPERTVECDWKTAGGARFTVLLPTD